jgi:hypothetical protein
MLGAGRILSLSRLSSHAVPTCSTARRVDRGRTGARPRACLTWIVVPPARKPQMILRIRLLSPVSALIPCSLRRAPDIDGFPVRDQPRAAGSRQQASVAVVPVTVPRGRASPSTANRIKRRGRRPHQRAAGPERAASATRRRGPTAAGHRPMRAAARGVHV